ncbi:MAG: hypothetical protein EHM12_11350 [Dehalococcoidia bacterium]|nr:MAG: hypothetical protein EHM12_11350 [Dehalococcoidia bacterium]
MGTYTDLYTTQTLSTTGTRKRDVGDTIRHLMPSASLMPLVSSGNIEGIEGVSRERKLFGKRKVKSPLFEGFTWSPFAITFTTTSYDGSTALVVTSTTGIVGKMSLVNTSNNTTCYVDSVTNGTTLVVTTYGATAFSAAAGDVLMCLTIHMEEKSSVPPILMKDPDNFNNITFIHRSATGISWTARQSEHFGGDRYTHMKKESHTSAMRNISNTLLFDNKPGSGEKNTSGLGTTYGSCDGLVAFAGSEFDFRGAPTYESFINEGPLKWGDSVSSDTTMLMFCGYEFWATILGWMNSGLCECEPGTYDKWGVKSNKLMTCRGDVEVMIIDAYNRGDFKRQALVCNPENIDFIYLNNCDLQIREGIQNASVHGDEDELWGEISIMSNDNGDSICKYVNVL